MVVSHIDHGKSTLADRFLELTGAISKGKMKEQFLDSMDLEREKGITIKMHPVRLIWRPSQADVSGFKIENLKFKISDSGYILNLIDTPGHIDFSYEISRALACVEGALLLVDAVKGIQAQTIYNLNQAQKQGLTIIGAVNKIDLPQAQTEQTKQEIAKVLNVNPDEIFTISGKTGENVELLLQAIVQKVPAPVASDDRGTFKALVFDSKYDSFSGIIAYVRVFDGQISANDKIYFMQADYHGESKEVGYFMPHFVPANTLSAGEIGYIKTGIKEPAKVKVGETIILSNEVTGVKSKKREIIGYGENIGYSAQPSNNDKNVPTPTSEEATNTNQKSSFIGYGKPIGYSVITPLPGYREPQPVLFLSLYPYNSDNFDALRDGLEKLRLNDPALSFAVESKMVLGRGFRIGFLGSLHAEITIRRLKEEFGLEIIATSPQVIFKAILKNGEERLVFSPSLWPDQTLLQEAQEPWADLEIIVPNDYIGKLFPVLQNFNVFLQETKFLTPQKSVLRACAPLREIISGVFYDKMKTITEGYGSFSFESTGYQKNDLVKMDILIAGEPCEAFARIVPKNDAFELGKKFLHKLKDALPPQQFVVALQATVGGKIIARENISARRKDVTAPLYGGDVTRKRKLLDIQKKGKKELQSKGRVNIPANVFLEMLRD